MAALPVRLPPPDSQRRLRGHMARQAPVSVGGASASHGNHSRPGPPPLRERAAMERRVREAKEGKG